MGVKMQTVKELRYKNARKWEEYYENGGKTTPEVIKQMREEDAELVRLGKEATKEWLSEQ